MKNTSDYLAYINVYSWCFVVLLIQFNHDLQNNYTLVINCTMGVRIISVKIPKYAVQD